MEDEFGCLFSDAAFPVYVPDDEQADIQQLFELERERLLRDYPLEHPEYDLVFDFFAESPEPLKYGDKKILGLVIFRSYKSEQQRNHWDL